MKLGSLAKAYGAAQTVLGAAGHLHDELEHQWAGSFLGWMAAPACQEDPGIRNGEIPKGLPSLVPGRRRSRECAAPQPTGIGRCDASSCREWMSSLVKMLARWYSIALVDR